jgi:two-component system response regulator DesR
MSYDPDVVIGELGYRGAALLGGVVIRVLLVENDCREWSRLAVSLAEVSDMVVVGDFDIEEEAASLAANLLPDVLVMNTRSMVGELGPVIGDFRIRNPKCAVIVLCDPRKCGMLPSGRLAKGLSLTVKGAPTPVLAETIRRVVSGEQIIDTRLAVASIAARRPVSERELEVLSLASRGEPVADIARRLSLTPGTVRNHVSSAITKTGARNRLDAIWILRRNGWLR